MAEAASALLLPLQRHARALSVDHNYVRCSSSLENDSSDSSFFRPPSPPAPEDRSPRLGFHYRR